MRLEQIKSFNLKLDRDEELSMEKTLDVLRSIKKILNENRDLVLENEESDEICFLEETIDTLEILLYENVNIREF